MTRSERQALIIEKWKQAKCRGSVVACTGFGKTKTALDAITRVLTKNPSVQIVIIVPTKILQDQWLLKLSEYELLSNTQVLVLNTAAKYKFNCDFLIVDWKILSTLNPAN